MVSECEDADRLDTCPHTLGHTHTLILISRLTAQIRRSKSARRQVFPSFLREATSRELSACFTSTKRFVNASAVTQFRAAFIVKK